MFSYFFNYGQPEKKKIIINNDTQKYYKHIKLMKELKKELKKFIIYKNSFYLKALMKNKINETYTQKRKLDYLYYKQFAQTKKKKII